MTKWIRLLTAWGFTALHWTFILFLQGMSFRHVPDWIMASALRNWGLISLRIVGVRLELVNENPLEKRASRVVVSNHQSGLDMIACACISPEGILVAGKKEIKYIPFINFGWWAFNFLFLDRSNPQKAIASLSGVSEAIVQQKRTFWLFPEGTRSPAGEVGKFKKGAFHIAIQSQTPIYPVVLQGAGALLPKHGFLPKPGVIRIKFLPPVETKGMTAQDVDALTLRVQEQVAQAHAEMEKRP